MLYRIHVKTAKGSDAGTNAHVGIEIIGTNGTKSVDLTQNNWIGQNLSGKVYLPEDIPFLVTYDLFERGKEDVFEQEIEDLGKITKLNLRIDSAGNKPGWKLKRIALVNRSAKPAVVTGFGFKIGHRWLGDNNPTVVQLLPGDEN